jgi:hypothetical protein
LNIGKGNKKEGILSYEDAPPGTNNKPALLLAEAERALYGTQSGALEGR